MGNPNPLQKQILLLKESKKRGSAMHVDAKVMRIWNVNSYWTQAINIQMQTHRLYIGRTATRENNGPQRDMKPCPSPKL